LGNIGFLLVPSHQFSGSTYNTSELIQLNSIEKLGEKKGGVFSNKLSLVHRPDEPGAGDGLRGGGGGGEAAAVGGVVGERSAPDGCAHSVEVVIVGPDGKPELFGKHGEDRVQNDVATLFWRLPASFTRSEVCEVLGYEPDRTLLYRALRELVREGHLAVEEHGSGQRATLYRKTTQPDSPPPP
jgi:hypothetical protein